MHSNVPVTNTTITTPSLQYWSHILQSIWLSAWQCPLPCGFDKHSPISSWTLNLAKTTVLCVFLSPIKLSVNPQYGKDDCVTDLIHEHVLSAQKAGILSILWLTMYEFIWYPSSGMSLAIVQHRKAELGTLYSLTFLVICTKRPHYVKCLHGHPCPGMLLYYESELGIAQ